MDDDHRKEEQPSTSKNETNKERNADERQERRRDRDDEYDDGDQDDCTETDTSASILSSVRSRLGLRADTRPDMPKPPGGKRDRPDRKKKVRRGRVSKRRRSARRYQRSRRVPKRNSNDARRRDHSVSSAFTRISSHSGTESVSCRFCGHRCCGRRSAELEQKEIIRRQRKQLVRKITERLRDVKSETSSINSKGKRKNTKLKGILKKKRIIINLAKSTEEPKREKLRRKGKKRCIPDDKKKGKPEKDESEEPPENHVLNKPCSESKSNQVGSASKMFSPLIIKTNAVILEEEEVQEEKQNYNEITPEMIFQTLRKLQMTKEYLNLDSILNDMKLCYPVNPNLVELSFELVEKLKVAVIAGIVIQDPIGNTESWGLASDIKKRGLNQSQVSLFWQTYGETLSGVKRKSTIINCQNANKTLMETECL